MFWNNYESSSLWTLRKKILVPKTLTFTSNRVNFITFLYYTTGSGTNDNYMEHGVNHVITQHTHCLPTHCKDMIDTSDILPKIGSNWNEWTAVILENANKSDFWKAFDMTTQTHSSIMYITHSLTEKKMFAFWVTYQVSTRDGTPTNSYQCTNNKPSDYPHFDPVNFDIMYIYIYYDKLSTTLLAQQ